MFTIVSPVLSISSWSRMPFLLAFWLQFVLFISSFAFRSPIMTVWSSLCLLMSVVRSWNCLSTSSFFAFSCRPYITAMFIVILPFTLIHSVYLLVSILVPLISDTILFISFLIRKPTPPPFPVSLFFPIHLYPCMLMFSLEVS